MSNLVAQLTSPVRWTQTVNRMIADGASEFVEVGPGSVLQGLIKKINKDAVTTAARNGQLLTDITAIPFFPSILIINGFSNLICLKNLLLANDLLLLKPVPPDGSVIGILIDREVTDIH